jgi:RNA polymerase sigma-70 factor (ECF subfamily)
MLSPTATPDLQEGLADHQLMLAYVAGDTVAFDVLYTRHEGALYRFVRRLLGIRLAAEVDDVYRQIWQRIVSARDSFAPEDATWRTWAFGIACNLAIDRLRLTGREFGFYAHDEDGDGLEAAQLFSRGLLRDPDAAPGDTAQPSEQELVFWGAAGRRMLACLDELTDDQRAAFLLYHEEGFSVEVLARTLEVEPETVRNRLLQGLNKLRQCMERYLSVLEHRP